MSDGNTKTSCCPSRSMRMRPRSTESRAGFSIRRMWCSDIYNRDAGERFAADRFLQLMWQLVVRAGLRNRHQTKRSTVFRNNFADDVAGAVIRDRVFLPETPYPSWGSQSLFAHRLEWLDKPRSTDQLVTLDADLQVCVAGMGITLFELRAMTVRMDYPCGGVFGVAEQPYAPDRCSELRVQDGFVEYLLDARSGGDP